MSESNSGTNSSESKNVTDSAAPAALAARFAPLTVAGLPIVRGGYVWDEAQRRNVWRDEAVTVTMFDKTESGGKNEGS